MIQDAFLLLDPNNTAVTVTAPSTNVIDLFNARDIGVGDDPAIEIAVIALTTFLSAGATTLVVAWQGSTDNSTWTTMVQTDTIGKADITAGTYIFSCDVPRLRPAQAFPRYHRLNYTVATGPFTAGTVWAGLVLDSQFNTPRWGYPPGIVIAN
jgi:hypothetical protein